MDGCSAKTPERGCSVVDRSARAGAIHLLSCRSKRLRGDPGQCQFRSRRWLFQCLRWCQKLIVPGIMGFIPMRMTKRSQWWAWPGSAWGRVPPSIVGLLPTGTRHLDPDAKQTEAPTVLLEGLPSSCRPRGRGRGRPTVAYESALTGHWPADDGQWCCCIALLMSSS